MSKAHKVLEIVSASGLSIYATGTDLRMHNLAGEEHAAMTDENMDGERTERWL